MKNSSIISRGESAVNIHSHSFASLIRAIAGQVLRWGWPGSCFVGWNTPSGLSNEVPPLGGGTPSGLSNEVPAVGGRYPLWFIERSSRRWGAVPPYRTKFPPLGGGTPLSNEVPAVGGRYPPLVYRASLPPLGGGTPLLVLWV